MRGHVRKRGGTWAVVVDLGQDDKGRRRQKWHSGYRTRRDAAHALTDILARLDTRSYVEPSKQTVSQYLSEWLSAIRTTVGPGTWRSYRTNIEGHVLPRIGRLPLRQVTAIRLNALYADLLEQGRCDGKGGLSPRTVRYTHAILHRALRDAVRWGRLARNPADLADPPRANTPEMRVWTRVELARFLNHARNDRLYAAWLLLATTGLRRGELLGLRWADVDLAASRASVRQSLNSAAGKLEFLPPKTAKSKRSLALDPATVAALRSHRRAQFEERLAWGPAYRELDLVFCREDGTPVRPDSLSRSFSALVRAAGLSRIRLHDVRHTYATIALTAGTHPKVVAERLGHATIGITLDIYSHVLPSIQEEAATHVAALILSGEGEDSGVREQA